MKINGVISVYYLWPLWQTSYQNILHYRTESPVVCKVYSNKKQVRIGTSHTSFTYPHNSTIMMESLPLLWATTFFPFHRGEEGAQFKTDDLNQMQIFLDLVAENEIKFLDSLFCLNSYLYVAVPVPAGIICPRFKTIKNEFKEWILNLQ